LLALNVSVYKNSIIGLKLHILHGSASQGISTLMLLISTILELKNSDFTLMLLISTILELKIQVLPQKTPRT
jgi:hypothetical protein